jgi:exo-beta-1,3-glucanase (GH17 family)
MGYLFYFEAFDEQWKDNANQVLKIILINQSTSPSKV